MVKKRALNLPRGTKIPNHIAIIPDGNRRWARARGLHTFYGHKQGFDRATELGRAARDWGVHTVTLWGFSTENWDRTKEEIDYLMKLYVRLVDDYLKEADRDKVKLVHLGRKDRLPKFLVDKIIEAEAKTAHHTKYVANLAIDYGGHDDIIRAVQGMIEDNVSQGKVNKHLFEQYLDTKGQPYPYVDLLIRTSGEQRTSGLLLWQMEYAEMYWETDHFPDFTPDKLREAILDYSRRRRRFGGNDSLEHFKFKPEMTAKLEVGWWRLSNIPEGTRFRDYAREHLKALYGLSTSHAKQAAHHMLEAIRQGEEKEWSQAQTNLKQFYILIKDELKLAFEPSIVASLELKLWQSLNNNKKELSGQYELDTREYLAEMYRISDFQAAKAAHLRALATAERRLAEFDGGEVHWDRAKDYLEEYYKALKDRIA
jgi:undecaprenyl diphosphate synthase